LDRLDLNDPRGFLLTLTVALGALAAWAFGGLTQDVIANDETALWDPQVASFVVAHRTPWLSSAMQIVTWLGSTFFIVPLLVVVAAVIVARRRDWRAVVLLTISVAGALAVHGIVGSFVGRARPPAALSIGQFGGASFPSQHATAAVACYAMLAVVLSAGRSVRLGAAVWLGAALVILLVGVSRIYLGAHWLTDVLGGYSLGGTWVALVLAGSLLYPSRSGHGQSLGRRRAA
jgi:undecaprenyl-diphosphatase